MVAVFGGLMASSSPARVAAFGQFGLLQVCAVGAVSVALLAVHHRRHGTLHCRSRASDPGGWAWVAGLGSWSACGRGGHQRSSFETDTVRYHIVNAAHLLTRAHSGRFPTPNPASIRRRPRGRELLNALLMLAVTPTVSPTSPTSSGWACSAQLGGVPAPAVPPGGGRRWPGCRGGMRSWSTSSGTQ